MNTIVKDRDKYIGGSDLPKIMTVSNLYKFAQEKLNPIFFGNSMTHYGHFMEDIVRDWINQKYNYDFQPDCAIKGIYRGNCDGLDTYNKKLLEVKTCGGDFEISKYMSQIQCYLELFNIKTCMLAVYERPFNYFMWGDETDKQSYNLDFDPDKLEIYEIQREKNIWKQIDKKASRFHKGLLAMKLNPNITERDFNIELYGEKLVNLSERWVDDKEIKIICSKYNIDNAQIGNIKITSMDVCEFGVDIKKLALEMPEVFERYKTINSNKTIILRRRRQYVTSERA